MDPGPNSSTTYRFDQSGRYAVVTLLPQLNEVQWSEIETIGDRVLERIESGNVTNLVVDLAPLKYIGSATVALVVRWWKAIKAKKNGRTLVVCQDENVMQVLKLAGLTEHWRIVSTRDEAIRELGGSSEMFKVSADESERASAGTPWLLVLAAICLGVAVLGLILQLTGTLTADVALALLLGGSGLAFILGLISLATQIGTMKTASVVVVVLAAVLGGYGLTRIGDFGRLDVDVAEPEGLDLPDEAPELDETGLVDRDVIPEESQTPPLRSDEADQRLPQPEEELAPGTILGEEDPEEPPE